MTAAGRTANDRATAVVVNFKTKELTAEAVSSALREPEVEEVVVVDNASEDDSVDYLRRSFDTCPVRVLESRHNRGFGPAVNAAAVDCRSPLLLILNSDATLIPTAVARLAAVLADDDAGGVVAPAIYRPDGVTLQPGVYGRLPSRRDILVSKGWVRTRTDDADLVTAPEWVSGVAMLLRRADFLDVGGFDETFRMYLEDVDLCRRLREAGKKVRREPAARVLHRGGESWPSRREQRRKFHESKLRYYEKLGATRFELNCVRTIGRIRLALER